MRSTPQPAPIGRSGEIRQTLRQSLLLDVHACFLCPGADLQHGLQAVAALLADRLGYPHVCAEWSDPNAGNAGKVATRDDGAQVTGAEANRNQPELRDEGSRHDQYPCDPAPEAGAPDPVRARIVEEGAHARIVLPLCCGGRMLASLWVRAGAGYRFRKGEIALLEAIGAICAAHVTYATNLERLAWTKCVSEQMGQAAAVFDSAMEGIFITDLNGRILAANPAVCRISWYSEEELVGATPAIFRSGRHDRAFYDGFWRALRQTGSWRGEIWNRRKNGDEYPELLCVSAIHDAHGEVNRYVALLVDISAQKKIEVDLEYLARHDELTGLPNRNGFRHHLSQVLGYAAAEGHSVAVALVDLDEFKYVNQVLGHHEGDALIRIIAQRLRASLRKEDGLARLGGDEFGIVLPGVTDAGEAAVVTRKLLDVLARPMTMAGCELLVTGSVGIALFPHDGQDPDALLRRADSALHEAKEIGNDTIQHYHPEMEAQTSERLTISSTLKSAFDQGDLFLVYQPQVDVRSDEVVGVEALLRWRRGDELVGPHHFVPVAERTGLIIEIGRWVLREACEQARRWHEAGWGELRMAVNLSARQFRERGLAATIRAALDDSGLAPHCLQIEITESLSMDSTAGSAATFALLREMGVCVAIDDFGTGYSSLAYLARFPLDTLKIDLSFVRAIGHDPRTEAIIRALATMTGALDLELVAEGVETRAQLDFLRDAGCNVIQGYLLGKPMASGEFERWIAARRKAGPSQVRNVHG